MSKKFTQAPFVNTEAFNYALASASGQDAEMQKRIHDLANRIYAAEGKLPVITRQDHPEQWKVWRYWRRQHKQSVRFMDRSERWTVLTEWPPADFDALEAEYAVDGRKMRALR